LSELTCSNTLQGTVYNTNANYYTCRNAANGTIWGAGTFLVGQTLVGSTYTIRRGFIYFDTSGIPSDAEIVSAIVTLPSMDARNDTDFNIFIRGADSAGSSLAVGDYDLTHYDGEDLGELTTFPPVTDNDYKYFTLNSNGRSYINRGGTTKFVFLSKEDIDNDPPTDNEWIYVATIGDYKMTVTYFQPTDAPTVSTLDDDCKDRQSTTLTATGNVTSAGGGYTYRGFEYYEYTGGVYDSSMYAVREKGTFASTGEFEMTLSGLKPATTYYIRAYAGNVFGIDYGDWVICCTIAGSPSTYDVYTEPNTARYRLYVSDDEVIAWRGYKGPYSGKQTLINISDIINKTKGVKVLKVDLPDANTKGNFHICITVKQTLKG